MIAQCIPSIGLSSTDGQAAAEPVRVTVAGAADAGQLAALHAAAFARGWSAAEFARLLIEPNVIADRAVMGARLAGFVMSRAAADEAEVLSIAVAAPYRRLGIARRLIAANIRRLAAAGVDTLFLEVDEHNAPARHLYAAFGFREIGRRKGYYAEPGQEPSTAIVLRRVLTETGRFDCCRSGRPAT